MEAADKKGNTRKIYNAVKALAAKTEKPQKNLIINQQGELLTSAEDVAEEWFKFLSKKFAATPEQNYWAEQTRGSECQNQDI